MDRYGDSAFGSIDFSRRRSAVDLTGKVHQLPCCIKYDGPSFVSHYFKAIPTGVEVEDLKVKEAYFRGRKLQGAIIPLPQGYCGFVLGRKSVGKRKASVIFGEQLNRWEVNAKFQSITFWNHYSLPSQHDAVLRSLHWLTVAKALHQPVTSEDLRLVSVVDK